MGLFNSLTKVGDVGRRKSITLPRWEVGDVFIKKKKKKEVDDAFTVVSHLKVGIASTTVSHIETACTVYNFFFFFDKQYIKL